MCSDCRSIGLTMFESGRISCPNIGLLPNARVGNPNGEQPLVGRIEPWVSEDGKPFEEPIKFPVVPESPFEFPAPNVKLPLKTNLLDGASSDNFVPKLTPSPAPLMQDDDCPEPRGERVF
uniref:Uncharacterized protein n=1 Tax=Cacopsylla melanoneura TaxID=428564 RepID=A0A8D8SVH5_9HEMI